MHESSVQDAPQFSLDRLRQPGDEHAALNDLLQQSEAINGYYDILEVEGAGWEVRLGQNEPGFSGNDWVLYDLDDTLVAYSGAKPARQRNYNSYLQETGLDNVDEAVAERIMGMTDAFARWDEQGREMYHVEAHMQALAWATGELRKMNDQPDSLPQAVDAIQGSLQRMSAAREGQEVGLTEGDPFYLHEGHLVGRVGVADSEAIETVFDAMLRPTPHDEVVASMQKVKTESLEQPAPDVGIFTYGEPIFQLAKTLALMEQAAAAGHPLPVSRILLTKVPKGDFIGEMAYEAGMHGENWSPYFNIIRPHSLLLVDDNPVELTSFEDLNHYVMQRSRTGVAALRIHHDPGAKTAQRPWQDNPRRTQFFPRMTYEADDSEPLTQKILWALHQARIEVAEWDRYGHPEYFDDFGYGERYEASR